MFMVNKMREDRDCYASEEQQNLLNELAGIDFIHTNFFLTGGTALSVFFLRHRTSEDLNFFTIDSVDLSVLDTVLKRIFSGETTVIQSSRMFLSYLIADVKVDFVIDPLSSKDIRPKLILGLGNSISIDTLDNICSNKLATVMSRLEIKDIIDLYFISIELWNKSEDRFFKDVMKMLKKRKHCLMTLQQQRINLSRLCCLLYRKEMNYPSF